MAQILPGNVNPNTFIKQCTHCGLQELINCRFIWTGFRNCADLNSRLNTDDEFISCPSYQLPFGVKSKSARAFHLKVCVKPPEDLHLDELFLYFAQINLAHNFTGKFLQIEILFWQSSQENIIAADA